MNINNTLNLRAGLLCCAMGMMCGSTGVLAQAIAVESAASPAAAAPIVVTANPPRAIELAIPKPISDADLWQRVRRGFSMGELDSPLVQEHEQWYSTRPDYIQRFVDRGSKYLYHVVEEVERRGMPTEVALLPIIESAFNPQAYSRARASGMWQFIPSTGKNFGLKQDWMTDNRRDVLLSTDAALDYLQKLYGMFHSWELAFAAYNCGEGCVAKAIQKNQRKGLPTDFLSLTLPPETRAYVPKLIAVKNIILAPGSYGIELEAMENRPYFRKVEAPSKIDVQLAARLAEMPADEFSALNPSFNRPVASSGTGYFLVPADKADTFRENLELYRSLNGPMVSWQTANARRGESVESVARRYGLTSSYLRATNIALPEKKGKFTQAATIMVPMNKEAQIITATLDRKLALKASQPAAEVKAAISSQTAAVVAAPEPAVVASGNVTMTAQAAPDMAPPNSQVAIVNAPVASVAHNAAALAATAVATEPAPSEYRVATGDTLFSISKRFGMTVDQVKARNHLTANSLSVGQTLQIAVDGSIEQAAPNPSLMRASIAAPAKPASPRLYTVRTGDNLFAIAIKFGVELDDLMRWNKLSARSVIRPGLKIRVAG